MSSSKDKLRAASRKNSEMHKVPIFQETLVSSIVNRTSNEGLTSKNSAEDVKPSDIEQLIEKEQENQNIEPVVVGADTAPQSIETPPEIAAEPVLSETEENIVSAEVKTEDVSAESPVQKKEPAKKGVPKAKKEEKKTENVNLEDKFNGREVTVTLILLPEVCDFFVRHSLKTRQPMKNYFKNLLMNELANGSAEDEPELLAMYRQTQHNTVKKSVPVAQDLQEAVKDAAADYGMRYTNFMAYVIHKALKNAEKN